MEEMNPPTSQNYFLQYTIYVLVSVNCLLVKPQTLLPPLYTIVVRLETQNFVIQQTHILYF